MSDKTDTVQMDEGGGMNMEKNEENHTYIESERRFGAVMGRVDKWGEKANRRLTIIACVHCIMSGLLIIAVLVLLLQ